jgi:hypothetical protein
VPSGPTPVDTVVAQQAPDDRHSCWNSTASPLPGAAHDAVGTSIPSMPVTLGISGRAGFAVLFP